MGDRMAGIVDQVAEALDLADSERDALEQLIAEDPHAFGLKYQGFLNERDLALLGVESDA